MEIRVTRSDRRAKTVSARLVDGVLEVRAPAQMSDAELQPIIATLQRRLERRQRPPAPSDGDLEAIAEQLNQRYFQGALRWESIAWSARQEKRFGSCTPARRTIRISTQLQRMPQFVLEYVVMHELAHLLEANHGPRFWRLVNRYPRTERARGYLMAVGVEGLGEDLPGTA